MLGIQRFFFVLVALSWLCAPPAGAQSYPSRPIKLVIPFSAGSVTDQISRMVGQALTERTQQPTVVESRTGAGGIVAMKAVQQSPADGYPVGLVSASATVRKWGAVIKAAGIKPQ